MADLDEQALSAAWMHFVRLSFVRLSCGYDVNRVILAEAIETYLAALPKAEAVDATLRLHHGDFNAR